MLTDRIGNRDATQGYAKLLAKTLGIGFCALGCTKARHGNADDLLARHAEQIGGSDGNEQGKAGIQATRDADDAGFRIGADDSLCQALRLNG